MQYAVVIERARSNYSAFVPELPGCIATGKTVAAVKKNIAAAIRLHLSGLDQDEASGSRTARIARHRLKR
jgi:predicted RNase H-like HicB family nuclease